jgi:hypothetical protein
MEREGLYKTNKIIERAEIIFCSRNGDKVDRNWIGIFIMEDNERDCLMSSRWAVSSMDEFEHKPVIIFKTTVCIFFLVLRLTENFKFLN